MTTVPSCFQAELSVTQAICQLVDTPRALTVSILASSGEYEQLVGLDISAMRYEDASNFADDYLVSSLLKKSRSIPTSIDTRAVAITSFLESEKRCRETNTTFYGSRARPSWYGRFCREVAKVLGVLDSRALQQIILLCRHGSGVSVGVKGDGLVVSDKYDYRPSITEELLPFYEAIVGPTWFEYRPHPVVVPGGSFFTVPKNAKTDRGCVTEPTVNQYLQQGIGRYLRKRLALFGVDIGDQTINQAWASMAQELGLATLDLSSASDMISSGLVLDCLPPDWLHLLWLARSHQCAVGDAVVVLEKFCTMGNGFTFALETLLFFCAMRAIVPVEDHWGVTCYGDDLIVPQRHAQAVVDGLESLGFEINKKKSCLAGRFFESCGTDWFDGQNVRPLYLRQEPESPVPPTLWIANRLREYAHRMMCGFACDQRFQGIWQDLFQQAPVAWRSCLVPATAGDVGFIVARREAGATSIALRSGSTWHEGWRYKRIKSVPEKADKRTFGVLLAALAGADLFETSPDSDYRVDWRVDRASLSSKGLEPMRGYLRLVRPSWATVSRWPEGFDWV